MGTLRIAVVVAAMIAASASSASAQVPMLGGKYSGSVTIAASVWTVISTATGAATPPIRTARM